MHYVKIWGVAGGNTVKTDTGRSLTEIDQEMVFTDQMMFDDQHNMQGPHVNVYTRFGSAGLVMYDMRER